jgi:hypothetical protein
MLESGYSAFAYMLQSGAVMPKYKPAKSMPEAMWTHWNERYMRTWKLSETNLTPCLSAGLRHVDSFIADTDLYEKGAFGSPREVCPLLTCARLCNVSSKKAQNIRK